MFLLFEKYIKKLRITPSWDVRLELIEDPTWPKTGDFKIDVTPVSGSMADFARTMRMSKETVQYDTLSVPAVTVLEGVTVAGSEE